MFLSSRWLVITVTVSTLFAAACGGTEQTPGPDSGPDTGGPDRGPGPDGETDGGPDGSGDGPAPDEVAPDRVVPPDGPGPDRGPDGPINPVAGLTVISELDVLGNGGNGGSMLRGPAPLHMFNAEGTEYSSSGIVTVRSFSPSEIFDTVGSVLCVVSQFRAEERVNQGQYVVHYDQSRCKAAANSRSGQAPGFTASEGGSQYALAYVESTRADETSPQYVRAWVPFGGGGLDFGAPLLVDSGQFGYKQVDLRIDESPSAKLPYGRFAIRWTNLGNTTGGSFLTLDDATFPGYFGFQYFEANPVGENYPRPGDFVSDVRRGTVYLDAEGTSGFALSEARYFNGQGTIGEPYDWTVLPPAEAEYFSRVAEVSQMTVGGGQVRVRLGQTVDDLAAAEEHCLAVASETPFVDRLQVFDAANGDAEYRVTMIPYRVAGCQGNGEIYFDGRINQIPGCATTVAEGSTILTRPAPRDVIEMEVEWSLVTVDATNQVVTLQNVATGEMRTLDKPLLFSYTHAAANDRFQTGGYDGQTFALRVDESALDGLPYTGPDYLYVPIGFIPYYDLSLNDGLIFTDTNGSGRDFTTKARRISTWFPEELATDACQDLAFRDLTINAATVYPFEAQSMGPDPQLQNGAPLYIGGEPVPTP